MADLVFNNMKAEWKHWCSLPAAADALVVVLVEAAGIEVDDVLNNYDDLAALLAASNNEQTAQARKIITSSVTITVNDTTNLVDVDVPDQVWTGLTGNPTAKLLFCYDGDTGAGTDANIRPISAHDFAVTPDGTDVTAQIAASGILRAS